MDDMCGSHVFGLARQRHRDLLIVAKSARLIRRTAHQHRSYHRCYERTLAWLGRWLVKWGWRLQERYGIASTHWAVV
jgi:hypothetical protein